MPEDEYAAVERAARRRGEPLSKVVRDSLRHSLDQESEVDPERRIAAILRFARFSGPTGDIEDVLEDIERGRSLR